LREATCLRQEQVDVCVNNSDYHAAAIKGRVRGDELGRANGRAR
jgi:hypothetical protein